MQSREKGEQASPQDMEDEEWNTVFFPKHFHFDKEYRSIEDEIEKIG